MTNQGRILLVEGDADLGRMLADHLSQAGHCVTLAADGPEARSAAAGHQLAILDQSLEADWAGTLKESGLAVLVVAKPLRLSALAARVDEALAKAQALPPTPIGGTLFDPASRLLETADGTRTRLTDKEAAILEALLRAEGVVARETLLAGIWGYGAGIDTHTLETHVYRLRRKLPADVLVTEAGGYRLVR